MLCISPTPPAPPYGRLFRVQKVVFSTRMLGRPVKRKISTVLSLCVLYSLLNNTLIQRETFHTSVSFMLELDVICM